MYSSLVYVFRYRMDETEGSPLFGIDLALEAEGKICVGDVVYLRQ